MVRVLTTLNKEVEPRFENFYCIYRILHININCQVGDFMKNTVLSTTLLNIFFDESGTKSDKPTLMGGLLIPTTIYDTKEFKEMNTKLREKNYTKLHWTDFTGYSPMENDILEVLNTFCEVAHFSKMNVINYNENPLDIRKTLYNADNKTAEVLSQRMIYTKLPERILYGLLRNYGKDVYVKSQLFVEESRRYRDFKLNQTLVDQLNLQSMYRGEQFSVISFDFRKKREEIGVEITDLLLGFIRTVIRNDVIPFGLSNEELKAHKLKGKKAKKDLAVKLLLNPKFRTFISSIKFYEWESNNELNQRDFDEYVTLFMAQNYKDFQTEHELEKAALFPPKKKLNRRKARTKVNKTNFKYLK